MSTPERLHILGICGTFMGGLAALARELGDHVSGSDAAVYPPMSEQLAALGIELSQGYRPEHLQPRPDRVLVGNALSRGNPAVEALLDAGLPYLSGPAWLAERVLRGRQVLAVAGTHGKTTTTSLLAFILDQAGQDPGYLIGGVAEDFPTSARLGTGRAFVIEADEYDSAFFDKRSKFLHYRPRIAILNNLEFDHADIFPDLAAIQRQFHHLVRTIPGTGQLLVKAGDAALAETLAMGCWTPVETFGRTADAHWRAELLRPDGSTFRVFRGEQCLGETEWRLRGGYNVDNALAALAAAHHVGVSASVALTALQRFRGVRRRQQFLGEARGVRVYDDFAHHPTAIRETLAGFAAGEPGGRLLLALEPRSNTMRAGVHAAALPAALDQADKVAFYAPSHLAWSAQAMLAELQGRGRCHPDTEALIADLVTAARPGDRVIFMSNGGFENAARRFLATLAADD